MAKRSNGEDNVAVAVDNEKGTQYALKWAVDNLFTKGQTILTLIHVKTSGDGDTDSITKDIFLPFRAFCSRKEITCNEVILEDNDIGKALTDYVSAMSIQVLVIGTPTKTGIMRRFRTGETTGSVLRLSPDFCSVYVINKGKISSVKAAVGVAPPPVTNHGAQQNRNRDQNQYSNSSASSTSSSNSNSSQNHGRNMNFARDPSDLPSYQKPRAYFQEEMEMKSPFTRAGNRYEPPAMESDISMVSSGISGGGGGGRASIDRLFPSLYTDNSEPHLSGFSDSDNRSSISSYTSNRNSSYSPLEFSSSSIDAAQNTDDVEAEMRKLRLELKQTMDLYSNACKEAITAKETTRELQIWKQQEKQRIEEAKIAEEAALALAEREKAKCEAALEAAAAAQKLAELEAQKRKRAELRIIQETKEKKKAQDHLASGDLRYRRYSIEEIEEATHNFSESLKIGEGGYGPVYKGTLDHTPVAIKVLRPDAQQGRSQFQQEVEVLCCIRHPNMVLLLGACPEYGCLVYEFMANGSLEDQLFRRGPTPVLSWQLRFRISAEIATGLLFLHQAKPEPLVHRDLKPGNILIDRNFVSKISDVGLARLVPPSMANTVTQYHMTSTAGTFCYIDPEYQQTGMLGTKSDIYSLGIMLLQIVTGKSPMGLTHQVERAIEKGCFEEMLDPDVPDWPVEEALRFAKLALQCAELRRKDRPDLGKVVLPELNRLRALADGEGTINLAMEATSTTNTSRSSSQDVMSNPRSSQSGYSSSRPHSVQSGYSISRPHSVQSGYTSRTSIPDSPQSVHSGYASPQKRSTPGPRQIERVSRFEERRI